MSKCRRNPGGVRFIRANQQLPSSQIRAHLVTSSSILSRMQFSTIIGSLESSTSLKSFGDRHLQAKDSLVGAWKSSGPWPFPSTIQRTAIMWLDDNLCLTTCKNLLPIIIQNLVGDRPTWKLSLKVNFYVGHSSTIFQRNVEFIWWNLHSQ